MGPGGVCDSTRMFVYIPGTPIALLVPQAWNSSSGLIGLLDLLGLALMS